MELPTPGVIANAIIEDVKELLRTAHSESGEIVYEAKTVISRERVFQVETYVMRDLTRVQLDQPDGVSLAKVVGYIGFWFAKLKPINTVLRVGPGKRTELLDVNERVALLLVERFIWFMVSADPETMPTIWHDCGIKECVHKLKGSTVRGLCYKTKNQQFLSALDGRVGDYIVYGLRYRATGPYFLVNYVDQGLANSCEEICPPLFQQKV